MNDLYLLKRAYQVGQEQSIDPSTKIGAILVNNEGEILCKYANQFPKGVKSTPERWERPKDGSLNGGKYAIVVHAEFGCICKCASSGLKTEGLIMYCGCWVPCTMCARAIITANIKEVVCHKTFNTPGWDSEAEISRMLFKESGVVCREVEGEIGIEVVKGGKKVKV